MKKYAMAMLLMDTSAKLKFYGEYNPQKMFSELCTVDILCPDPNRRNSYITKCQNKDGGGYALISTNRVALSDWLMKYLLADGSTDRTSELLQEQCELAQRVEMVDFARIIWSPYCNNS